MIVYLCTPLKHGDFNHRMAARITAHGYTVTGAFQHSQDVTPLEIFKRDINLIRGCDIFVAVLKDYGKDLAAEVGTAFAWNIPRFGIDFTVLPTDIMCLQALGKIVKPPGVPEALRMAAAAAEAAKGKR